MNTVFIPDLWEEKEKVKVNFDLSNYATKTDLKNFVLKNTLIDMNNNRVTNLAAPNANKDAVTKDYIDSQVSNKLNKTGDIMRGSLDMNSNKITRVGDPTSNDHGVNKKYVDQIINRISSSIPYMNVWQYDYEGLKNLRVSYRTTVHEIKDEKFRDVASEKVLLFALCQYISSSQLSLTGTAAVNNIKDDIINFTLHVENKKGSSWTTSYKVFVYAIIIPSTVIQRVVRSADANEQADMYIVSQKTLTDLSS